MRPMQSIPGVVRLHGRVLHYPWGGHGFLPSWLNQPNPTGQPWAEYWLGAHCHAPSRLSLGDQQAEPVECLDQAIKSAPEAWLGSARLYDSLPFLVKLLDVARPLSIQLHPNAAQARAGFAHEQSAGIAIDAPCRNFQDPNPKPEFLLALSKFWLLYGLCPAQEIHRRLGNVPGLERLSRTLSEAGPCERVRAVFELMPEAACECVRSLTAYAGSLPDSTRLDRGTPWPWILDWRQMHQEHPEAQNDRGVLFFALMHIARLEPGDALMIDAGRPHAYLYGQGLEVMTSSNNVIRAGLTTKYCNPDLFVSLLEPCEKPPKILQSAFRRGIKSYRLNRPEFNPAVIRLNDPGRPVRLPALAGPAILVALEGEITVTPGPALHGGQAILIRPEIPLELEASKPAMLAWIRQGNDLGNSMHRAKD